MATGALGTGIDVRGIRHVVHLDAPYSMINYAQEAKRAGRDGERVEAVIVVEKKDWPAEDERQDVFVEPDRREVHSLIRTAGCRRRVIGRCLDNDVREYRAINAICCDNYFWMEGLCRGPNSQCCTSLRA